MKELFAGRVKVRGPKEERGHLAWGQAGPHKALVEMLDEGRHCHYRQRHTAKRVFERLMALGVDVQ